MGPPRWRQNRISPISFLPSQGAAGLLKCFGEHFAPSRGVVQGNSKGMLYEGRDLRCLTGFDQSRNFLQLVFGQCGCNFRGRYTNDHTIWGGRRN